MIFGFLGIQDSDFLEKKILDIGNVQSLKEKEDINVVIGILEKGTPNGFSNFSNFKKFILFTMDYRVSRSNFTRISSIISKFSWDNQYTDKISFVFKDFLSELNFFLGMLKHNGQEETLRRISTRYLELFYFKKEFNFQDLMQRLNLQVNLELEIELIYLIRFSINSAELDHTQVILIILFKRSEFISWAKSKSKFQKKLTAESITALNFLNECRFIFSR